MAFEPQNASFFFTSRQLSRFVVEMEPLSQLCVINACRNLCGKLMQCLLL